MSSAQSIKRQDSAADSQPMRVLGTAIAFVLFAQSATATPDSATWRRQALVGENAEYFFRYVTISEYPASYYSHRRTLRLERVRKADFNVVEQFQLRDVVYSESPLTGVRREKSQTLPSFDLSAYLARNTVHLPFSEDVSRTFSIDSTGVWDVFEDGRVELAGRADLLRQIPNLGEEARVVGIEETDYKPPTGQKAYFYLRIWSNSAASDDNWAEDLLLVNQFMFH